MAPFRVHFSPGFHQEQDVLGSNLIRADHVGKKPGFRRANCSGVALEVRRSTPLRTVNSLEQPPRKIRPGEELLRSSRSTLAQIPPRGILLLYPNSWWIWNHRIWWEIRPKSDVRHTSSWTIWRPRIWREIRPKSDERGEDQKVQEFHSL
jgi:hypothetical protein